MSPPVPAARSWLPLVTCKRSSPWTAALASTGRRTWSASRLGEGTDTNPFQLAGAAETCAAQFHGFCCCCRRSRMLQLLQGARLHAADRSTCSEVERSTKCSIFSVGVDGVDGVQEGAAAAAGVSMPCDQESYGTSGDPDQSSESIGGVGECRGCTGPVMIITPSRR